MPKRGSNVIYIRLAFLIFAIALVWAFTASVRWARQIREDSLWAAVSPKYVGEAIQEKEHGTPWQAVPFCASFDQQGFIVSDPRCSSLREKIPSTGLCGVQNLSRSSGGSADDSALARLPLFQFEHSLQTFVTANQCETLVLDVDSIFSPSAYAEWSRQVVSRLKTLDPELELVTVVRPAPGEQTQWRELCGIYDELIVLAYGNHVPGKTAIGEMAPLDWVRSTLTDALEGCPKEKVRLGIAAYGYEWKTGEVLPENQAGFPQVNDDFVETTKKRAQKFNLAHEMGIHKFFLWALGMEH